MEYEIPTYVNLYKNCDSIHLDVRFTKQIKRMLLERNEELQTINNFIDNFRTITNQNLNGVIKNLNNNNIESLHPRLNNFINYYNNNHYEEWYISGNIFTINNQDLNPIEHQYTYQLKRENEWDLLRNAIGFNKRIYNHLNITYPSTIIPARNNNLYFKDLNKNEGNNVNLQQILGNNNIITNLNIFNVHTPETMEMYLYVKYINKDKFFEFYKGKREKTKKFKRVIKKQIIPKEEETLENHLSKLRISNNTNLKIKEEKHPK
mmetsp:Transcript_27891/g.69943  ORF Transcript_27891/g.69943 Transcript_27891/m.69943 type:complete len:263 (-) Transcript_27891:86-874(-)